MKLRLLTATLLVALLGVAMLAPLTASAAKLFQVPVTGTAQPGDLPVAGTFKIQQFVAEGDTLYAVGVFSGTVGSQSYKNIPGKAEVQLSTTDPRADLSALQQVCDILFLELGPLHLDVLGLVVDLNEVVLEITAEQGQGNLLGNLLCAIVGLLDPGTPLENVLGQIANLLNQILRLLG